MRRFAPPEARPTRRSALTHKETQRGALHERAERCNARTQRIGRIACSLLDCLAWKRRTLREAPARAVVCCSPASIRVCCRSRIDDYLANRRRIAELVEANPRIEARDLSTRGWQDSRRATSIPLFLEKDLSGQRQLRGEDPRDGARSKVRRGGARQSIASRCWGERFTSRPSTRARVEIAATFRRPASAAGAIPLRARQEKGEDGLAGNPSGHRTERLVVAPIMINNWETDLDNRIYKQKRATPDRVTVKDLGRYFGKLGPISWAAGRPQASRTRASSRLNTRRVEFNYKPILLKWGGTRGISVEDVVGPASASRASRIDSGTTHSRRRLSPEEAELRRDLRRRSRMARARESTRRQER